MSASTRSSPPNILFVMTDQQRFDTIAALGAAPARTPNLDRLVRRGAACTNAYSTCPVCVPARYSIMTGCEPSKTSWLSNWVPGNSVSQRCGPYLAETLAARGYRTWGLGKFHTEPRLEPLGFEVHERSEELWPSEEEFLGDDYVRWLLARAPAFAHLEQVHGERTDMYYAPQTRAVPAAFSVESWLATRAVEELGRADPRPQFGFVSFITPHPPIAPPIPYNRMFNPDQMPSPVLGDPAIDAADDYLAWRTTPCGPRTSPPRRPASGALKALPFQPFPRVRIRQFARDVTDFGQGTKRERVLGSPAIPRRPRPPDSGSARASPPVRPPSAKIRE